MFSTNDKISIRQIQILILLILFSSNSITLPYVTSGFMKQNGWMLIISSAVLVIFFLYIIISLARIFPDDSFVYYGSKILFSPMGEIVSLFYLINIIFIAGLELRMFGELVKQTLLSETPIEIIIVSMLFVVAYLNRKGIECRARIAELIIFITFIPISLILLLSLKEVELAHLAPVLDVDFEGFIHGTYHVSLLFSGIILLLFSYPYLNNRRGVFKALANSIVVVAIAGVIINLVTVGIFGYEETARQLWPVMSIMQVVEFPGAFIERQDALMMSFWILSVFAMINSFVYYSSLILSTIVRAKENDYFNIILIPIIYVVALIPDNVAESYELMYFIVEKVDIIFVFFIPLFFLVVAKIRKLGDKNEG